MLVLIEIALMSSFNEYSEVFLMGNKIEICLTMPVIWISVPMKR